MSDKVINLRTARKQAQRRKAAEEASHNARRHGRSKAEKQSEAEAARKARAHLDQHRLDE
ncbi:MAG: DUF4169 family protein [Paracoccaceae bacterium]